MKKQISSGIILALLNFYLLLYYKYSFHNYSLANFKIFYIGNLINVFVTVVLITFLVKFSLSKYSDKNHYMRKINFALFTAILPLVMVFMKKSLSINLGEFYFIQYPFNRFVSLMFLTVNFFIQVWIIFFLWNRMVHKKIIKKTKIKFLIYFMVFILTFPLIYRLIQPINESKPRYDHYGVVLGAAVWAQDKPSPIFKGRLDKAKEYLDKGLISKIFLTGGNAPGELTESEAAKIYLVGKGVDSSDIMMESVTSTTSEQINFIKLRLADLKENHSVKIFSDSFHLNRVKEMCKFYNVDPVLVSSEYEIKLPRLVWYHIRESIALLFFWLFSF